MGEGEEGNKAKKGGHVTVRADRGSSRLTWCGAGRRSPIGRGAGTSAAAWTLGHISGSGGSAVAMRAAAEAPGVLAAARRRPAELKLTAKKNSNKNKKKMVKRARPRAKEMEAAAAEEASRRARHLRAISGATAAERELEELVFGDSLVAEEAELLQRLAGPQVRLGRGGGFGAAGRRGPGSPAGGERPASRSASVPMRFRRAPRGAGHSRAAPAIRSRRTKSQGDSRLKGPPGWMKTMKPRKGARRARGGGRPRRSGCGQLPLQ